MFKGVHGETTETDKSGIPLNLSPEWVRRTICCARWETENAEVKFGAKTTPDFSTINQAREGKQTPKVILAVLASSPPVSPQSPPIKLSDASSDIPLTPVPLPAPSLPHTSKYEPRSSGTLVAHWAARAGIQLMEVNPTAAGLSATGNRGSEDDERAKRPHAHAQPHAHGPKGRRPSDGGGRGGLVERPPAVMAMMEMVAQPSKVVRVLARGEKLDPDP